MWFLAGRASAVWTIISALLFSSVVASHFEGGFFTWAPTGNGTEIKIDFRLSWKRSRYHCDDTTISSGDLIGQGELHCFEDSGCPVDQSLLVRCTDFSATDDWSSGRNSFTYTLSTTSNISFGFRGGSWRRLVVGRGSWSLKTTADVSRRPDTNRINSSPTVDISPVVALQHGCRHNIVLPVYDTDGDTIRCRFASESEECGGVCGSFPADLNETSCALQYTANGTTGWYAVAVQIEDFISANSTTPLSSVPLQFLVKVFKSTGSCSSGPEFVPPTPESDTCFPISVNEHLTFTVVAFSSAASIQGIETVKSGPSTNSSQFSNSTGNYMRLDVNWTPTDSNAGSQAMCFTAIDVNGQRSEQWCVRLYVEAKPNLVDVRKTESGSFIEWELIYDKRVERPDRSKYIFIYADDDIVNNDYNDYLMPVDSNISSYTDNLNHEYSGTINNDDKNTTINDDYYSLSEDDSFMYYIIDVTSNNVTFSGTSIRFRVHVDLAKSYFILLEEGVVLGGCKQPSVAMKNKTRLALKRKECPMPPTIDHGTWEFNSTVYGKQANLTCDRGYQSSGDVTLVCGEDATWHGQQPSCTLVVCPMPPTIDHGTWEYNSTVYDKQANLTCDRGYQSSGDVTLVCGEDATWHGQQPPCTLVACNTPDEGKFASSIYNETTYNESVTYTCNDGYFISTGNDRRRCEADAHWSGTAPTCAEKFRPGEKCLADLTGVSQCRGEEFSCRFDISTGDFRCLCSQELIFSPKETKCLKKSGYGESCQIREQCTTFLTECARPGLDQSTCVCPTRTSYNKTADECTTNAILFCPAARDQLGLWWNKTRVSTAAYQPCPEGSSGQIIRKCLIDGTLSSALYNCTKEIFKNLTTQIESNNITTKDALESLQRALKALNETNTSSSIHAGDVDDIETVLTHIVEKEDNKTASTEQLMKNAETFFDIADMLTDPETSGPVWASKVEQTKKGAEKFVELIDRYSLTLSETFESTNESTKTISKENIVISMSKVSEDPKDDLSYPFKNELPFNTSRTSSFILRSESLSGQTEKITSVVVVVYRNISKALPKTNAQQTSQSAVGTINSQVLSIQLLPKPEKKLDPPIQLTFSIDEHREGFESHCSFWEPSTNVTTGGWSTSGCTRTAANATTIQCSCNHLTNFAILMSPVETPSEHQTALTAISLTGCVVSIVCLVITLILHVTYWRVLKGDRNILAMTVCASLLVAYLLFVFGVTRTTVKGLCTTVAVLLHYTFLLVFFLLLAEGIYMALQVVLPFHKKSHLKELLIGAFAIPAVFVLIVASATELHGYGNDKYCWLIVDSLAFWMFVGPALIIIVFNLTIIILILKKMSSTKWIKDMSQREKAKTLASKTLVMLPVMGVTWLFGILSVHESAIWLQYVFVLFNSFQGLFIFLFHCVLNRQLRAAISKSRQNISTLSEETSRSHRNTDHAINLTSITHVEPTSTVANDFKTDQVMAASSAPKRIGDILPAIASEEEKRQFKKRHAISSQTHTCEDKPRRPPTQVLINLQHELRDRLRNVAHAVTARAIKMCNLAQQDTDVSTRNTNEQSLQKQPHDDQVQKISNLEEDVDADSVVGGGSEAETHVLVTIYRTDDLKDCKESKEDPKETNEGCSQNSKDPEEDKEEKEDLKQTEENQTGSRNDHKGSEDEQKDTGHNTTERNSLKSTVEETDLMVKVNEDVDAVKNDEEPGDAVAETVNEHDSKLESNGNNL